MYLAPHFLFDNRSGDYTAIHYERNSLTNLLAGQQAHLRTTVDRQLQQNRIARSLCDVRYMLDFCLVNPRPRIEEYLLGPALDRRFDCSRESCGARRMEGDSDIPCELPALGLARRRKNEETAQHD